MAEIPSAEFTAERLATPPGKNTRPTVVITKDWSIFIGNERAEDMTVDPFPLFGFGLGDFEEMVCEGDGAQDIINKFIPWKLGDDKDLVCLDSKLQPLCGVLHGMFSEHGLVDVQILDHSQTAKMRPVAAEGQEPVPAPFRFAIGISRGGKTHCFRPNQLDGQDMMNVKHQVLGQVFHGNYSRIGRTRRHLWFGKCLKAFQ